MKKSFTHRELRRIRKEISRVPGRYDTGKQLYVAIALPFDGNEATTDYAYALMLALKRVDCVANINMLLSFSRDIVADKPYEVLPYISIATPCIRVYNQRKPAQSGNLAVLLNQIKHYWNNLFTHSGFE